MSTYKKKCNTCNEWVTDLHDGNSSLELVKFLPGENFHSGWEPLL